MTTDVESRRAAELLLGQTLAEVTYVGLDAEPPDVRRWDFGDWHWPEVGVQFGTSTGDVFHAIWDSQVTSFELTLTEGPISDRWIPMREADTARACSWAVTDHLRWGHLVGSPLVSYDLIHCADESPAPAPVAVRLATAHAVAWIAAAAPKDEAHAVEDLDAADIYLEHDEVIVIFDDRRAERLGLRSGD